MSRHRYAVLLGAFLSMLSGCGGGDSSAPGCTFHAGALPEETLPQDAPRGTDIPVEHIVVLMQENRSFDSYFGQLPAAGHPDVDGLPAGTTNPDATGIAQPAFHQVKYCTEDTNHAWTGSHLEFNGGLNNGFITQNDPDGKRAMGFYDESDLPFYYALAKTFAIGDRYFCSLLGPTFPNRFYLMTGTSFGHIRNDMHQGGFPQRSIFDLLDENQISWMVYYSDLPFASLLKIQKPKFARTPKFLADAAAGTLPQVAFVDPAVGLTNVETDEHPPANIQQGEQFAAQIIEAVIQSPNWATTAMFLVYDEHGGFYDHVEPPGACHPDGIEPLLDKTDPDSNFPAHFDRYGFRVPLVVVSPFAKPGFVSHAVYDHTSILRFIETRFHLPALTDRDANASPMLDLFDFSQAALLNPAALPPVVVDPARLDQCKADFPGKVFGQAAQ